MDSTLAWEILGAIATVLGATFAAWLSGRSSQRTAKINVDSEAFDRGREIYESSIAELRASVQDVHTRLDATRQDLDAARAEIRTLRRSVSQYEGRVIQLQEVLRLHRIEVPPWAGVALDGGMLPLLDDPNQPPMTDPGGAM